MAGTRNVVHRMPWDILLDTAFPPLVSQTGSLILLSQYLIPGGQGQNLQGTSGASLWDLYLNVSLLLHPAGPRESQVQSSVGGGETALTLDGKKGKNHYATGYAYWDGRDFWSLSNLPD